MNSHLEKKKLFFIWKIGNKQNLILIVLQPNTGIFFSKSQLVFPQPPFHLISHFTIALNKVKGAVQLLSWNKCQREKSESTDPATGGGGDCAPWRPCRLSGGIIVLFIQVIVEGDDGADKFSELHKVSCDNVDATLPGSLGSDPLHHSWQGPGGMHKNTHTDTVRGRGKGGNKVTKDIERGRRRDDSWLAGLAQRGAHCDKRSLWRSMGCLQARHQLRGWHSEHLLDMFMWAKHQGRVLLLQMPRPAFCMTKFYELSPPHGCFLVLSSPALAACAAKRMDGILKDAYIKVTKRLVRMADSGVIKWIIHARKIDGLAAEAFHKLVTLRGSEIQTKLRVSRGEKTLLRRGDIERGRRRMRSIASGFWQLFKKNLNEVSVKCLGKPVETNMLLDLVKKCHNDSHMTVCVCARVCVNPCTWNFIGSCCG